MSDEGSSGPGLWSRLANWPSRKKIVNPPATYDTGETLDEIINALYDGGSSLGDSSGSRRD